jgi:uncharacterized protein (TIGR00269 family)
MRHHKLALCSEHYLEWFPAQTQRTIERYQMFGPSERVLVAVSGGKDSLALWDVLLRLGYQAEGLYIGLGINGGSYSDQSQAKAEQFVAEKWPDAKLHVVDVRETYGQTLPDLAQTKLRGRGKPCAVCGLVKRHIMNRVAYEDGFAALATGHNLDDEVAVLLQNTLHWQIGYLTRQAPVLPSIHPKLARKVKPFCRFYERETAAYALVRGIAYIYDECPHAIGNLTNFYKTLLNQLEVNSPGAKLGFYIEFLRARQEGVFAQAEAPALRECERCGQPTSAPELCAFCRLWMATDRHGYTDESGGAELSLL